MLEELSAIISGASDTLVDNYEDLDEGSHPPEVLGPEPDRVVDVLDNVSTFPRLL